jgi:hypothetical protein
VAGNGLLDRRALLGRGVHRPEIVAMASHRVAGANFSNLLRVSRLARPRNKVTATGHPSFVPQGVAGSFAAVILGGYGVAQVIASAL